MSCVSSPSTSRSPTRAGARSPISNPRTSSCAKAARCCRSNRCGWCASPPAAPDAPPPTIQSAADEQTRRRRGRSPAVRDLPRRVPRRERRRNRSRPRHADPVRRPRRLAPRSARRHEAARLAVRDPPDPRSRRGAARDRQLRGAQGRLRRRATPTSATTSPARRRASTLARSQVALSAINALAVHLGSLTDRRKTLIVATESVGRRRSSPRPGIPADHRNDHPLGEPLQRRRSIRSIRATRRRRRAGRGPATAGRRNRRPVRFRPTPTAGLRRVTADASAYYLLSFRTAHPDDGQFRELQARVNAPGRGRARAQGLLDRVAGRGAAHRADRESERAEGGRAAGAGAARQPADPPVVRDVARRERQDARDVRLGAGGAGSRRSRAPHRVEAGLPGAVGRRHACCSTVQSRRPDRPPSTSPRRLRRAPSSTYRRDGCGCGCRFRTRRRPCSIRMCARCRSAISRATWRSATPEIMRARTARDFRTLEAEAAVPVSSREFSRTEHLLIRFRAYGPAGAAPAVSAQLLDRAGHAMRALTVAAAHAVRGLHDRPAARRLRARRLRDRAEGGERRPRSERSHRRSGSPTSRPYSIYQDHPTQRTTQKPSFDRLRTGSCQLPAVSLSNREFSGFSVDRRDSPLRNRRRQYSLSVYVCG